MLGGMIMPGRKEEEREVWKCPASLPEGSVCKPVPIRSQSGHGDCLRVQDCRLASSIQGRLLRVVGEAESGQARPP